MADPILTNLSTYGGKWQKALIAQIFLQLADAGINVLEDIKGPTNFWKMKVGKGLKPYTGIWSAEDKLNLSDRKLNPEMFQYDIYIDPKKFHQTFAGDTQNKNSKYFGFLEEQYIWAKYTEEVAHEIIESTIWKGVKGGSSSDKAKNICNGFEVRVLEMIAAGKPSINTGVWTASNAVEKAIQMYRDAIATYPAFRRLKWMMYCSFANKDNYVDRYSTLYPYDPSNWDETGKPIIVKKTDSKVTLKPVEWLAGSNRIILAPMEIMAMGTDKLSDINVINMVMDVYGIKAGITGVIDLQILDDEACFFNELT
jgi:hypothetical protein